MVVSHKEKMSAGLYLRLRNATRRRRKSACLVELVLWPPTFINTQVAKIPNLIGISLIDICIKGIANCVLLLISAGLHKSSQSPVSSSTLNYKLYLLDTIFEQIVQSNVCSWLSCSSFFKCFLECASTLLWLLKCFPQCSHGYIEARAWMGEVGE